MTNLGDYEFEMQEYSGYLFQSFDPLGEYRLIGDFYDVQVEGVGSWAWITDDKRVTLVNLSALMSVDTDEQKHIILLPGEKIILDKLVLG